MEDGSPPVQVDVEFLAPTDIKLQKHNPKIIPGFRVLQSAPCAVAFPGARRIELPGEMINGSRNTVHLQVASVPDFLVMKAHAIAGRDKPKDVYDFCYCLDHFPEGIRALAQAWKDRRGPLIEGSLAILREKFATLESYGPRQLAEFHDDPDPDARAIHTRRAFESVTAFLRHF